MLHIWCALVVLGAVITRDCTATKEPVKISSTSSSLTDACILDTRFHNKHFLVDFRNSSLKASDVDKLTWTLSKLSGSRNASDSLHSSVIDSTSEGHLGYTLQRHFSMGVYSLTLTLVIFNGTEYNSTGYFINMCALINEAMNDNCSRIFDQLDELNINKEGLQSRRCHLIYSRKKRQLAADLDLGLRCISNCDIFIDQTSDVRLSLECTNCTSALSTGTWVLYSCWGFDGTFCSATVGEGILSSISEEFSVDTASTENFKAYMIDIQLDFEDSTSSSVSLIIRTEIVPPLEACEVSPVSGKAMDTLYSIDCHFMPADNIGIAFMLLVHENGAVDKLQEFNKMAADKGVILPQGIKSYDYNMHLSVGIFRGAVQIAETPMFIVQVNPAPMTNGEFFGMMDDVLALPDPNVVTTTSGSVTTSGFELIVRYTSKQAMLAHMEDLNARLNFLRSLSTTLNRDEIELEEDDYEMQWFLKSQKIKIRTKMIKQIDQVDATDLATVESVSSCLNTATQVKAEISEESNEIASFKFGDLATSMKEYSEEAPIETVSQIAGGVLDGVGRMMDVAINLTVSPPANLTADTLNQTVEEKMDRAKILTAKNLETVGTVSDTIIKNINTGESVSLLTSRDLSVKVEKRRAADFTNTSRSQSLLSDNGTQLTSSFRMPPGSGPLTDSQDSAIGLEMVLQNKNPYVWSDSGNDLTTPVLDVMLKDEHENKLNMTNLTEPVEFSLPLRGEGEAVDYDMSVSFTYDSGADKYVFKESESNFIAIQVAGNNDTNNSSAEYMTGYTTMVKFSLPSENISLIVYLARNNTPRTSEILGQGKKLSTLAPDAWLDDHNGVSGATPNSGVFFLQPKDENETIYIGIALDLSDQTTLEFFNITGNEGTVNVTIGIQTSSVACKYWDEDEQTWSTSGCKLDPATDFETLHCVCSHMTAFAGGCYIVMPNLVDPIADAYLFLTFFDNPVLPMAVLIFWIIYIVLLVWARRADQDDVDVNRVIVCGGPVENCNYSYLLCFFTGWWSGAGTTSSVYIYITGQKGISQRRCLNGSLKKRCFTTGAEDWFLLNTEESLGEIKSITVWHDNTGYSPNWYLTQVYIKDVETGQAWYFVLDDWLAIDQGIRQNLTATIPALPEEVFLSQHKHQFKLKFRQDLRENHLWISIFSKQPGSHLTRTQRLTCGLALILTEMLFNLIFHGIPTDNPEDQVGVSNIFSISLADIIIGLEVSLLIVPINIIILKLFTKVSNIQDNGKGPSKKERLRNKHFTDNLYHAADPLTHQFEVGDGAKRQRALPLPEIIVIEAPEQEQIDIYDPSNYGLTVQQSKEDLLSQSQTKLKKVILETKSKESHLPYWFLYVAWVIVILICLICSYFVMLYGLLYGYTESFEWLVSFFTGFFSEVMITQPLGVFGFAILLTLIFKRSVITIKSCPEEAIDDDNVFVSGIVDESCMKQPYTVPPSKKAVADARVERFLSWFTSNTIHGALLYVAFFFILLVVISRNTDINSDFLSTRSLQNFLIGKKDSTNPRDFYRVKDIDSFFVFMRTKLGPDLASIKEPSRDTNVRDISHVLLGAYRIRQIRVENGSCMSNEKVISDMFGELPPCFGDYFITEEDTGHYQAGWVPIEDIGYLDKWNYQTSSELGGLPFAAIMETYSGGGFVVDIPAGITEQTEVLEEIEREQWIDRKTRALFVEFTLYNPNLNIYSCVTLLFEVSSLGKVFPFHQILTERLRFSDPLLTIFHIIFFLFCFTFAYFEIKRGIKLGRKVYMKDPWNLIEVLQIALSITIVGFYLQRLFSVSDTIDEYLSSSNETFVNFYEAMEWTFILRAAMAFLMALIIVRFLKFMQYNWITFLIMEVFTQASSPLTALFIMMVIFTFSFTHFAYLAFGGSLYRYRNVWSTLVSMFNFAVRASPYNDLVAVKSVLGPTFFVVFILITKWCFLSLFVVIIRYARSLSKTSTRTSQKQFSFIRQIVEILKKKLNFIRFYKLKS